MRSSWCSYQSPLPCLTIVTTLTPPHLTETGSHFQSFHVYKQLERGWTLTFPWPCIHPVSSLYLVYLSRMRSQQLHSPCHHSWTKCRLATKIGRNTWTCRMLDLSASMLLCYCDACAVYLLLLWRGLQPTVMFKPAWVNLQTASPHIDVFLLVVSPSSWNLSCCLTHPCYSFRYLTL